MLKPFPKTNTGVEFHAILNANIDWELLGDDPSWETRFIVSTIKLNFSDEYNENINCPASEYWFNSF